VQRRGRTKDPALLPSSRKHLDLLGVSTLRMGVPNRLYSPMLVFLLNRTRFFGNSIKKLSWRQFFRSFGSSDEELLAWLHDVLRDNVGSVHRHFL
jgi:hypothetical protein